jgi:hypothetical protein
LPSAAAGKNFGLMNMQMSTFEDCAMILIEPEVLRHQSLKLAYAASARVDLFITNDARLSGKIIDGIQFIVSLDRAPL